MIAESTPEESNDNQFPSGRLIVSSTGEATLEGVPSMLSLQPDQSIAVILHAMTTARKEGRVQGRLDTNLDEIDELQSISLDDILDDLIKHTIHPTNITIYSSPTKRAFETTSLIALKLRRHGVVGSSAIRIDQRLIDMGQGSWEGMMKVDLASAPAWQRFSSGVDFSVRALGLSSDGSRPESLMDVLVRTFPFFYELSQKPGDALVVGHKVSTIVPALIFYSPTLLINDDGILNWRLNNLYSMNHLMTQHEVVSYIVGNMNRRRAVIERVE